MKFESPTCRLIIFLIFLLISLTSGELELYQGISRNVNYKTLKRILELQSYHNGMHHSRAEPHSSSLPYETYLSEDESYKKKLLYDILLENQRILEMWAKNKLNNINHGQQPEHILNEYPESIIKHDRLDINLESPSKTNKYPSVNVLYPERIFDEKMHFSHGNPDPSRVIHSNWKNYETHEEGNLMRKYQDNIHNSEESQFRNAMEMDSESNLSQKWHQPDFTYKFDEPSIDERDEFAVKPNDPRYYIGGRIVSNTKSNIETILHTDTRPGGIKNGKKTMEAEKLKVDIDYDTNTDFNKKYPDTRDVMPEAQRRIDQDVVVTATKYKWNNDAYFIAIVVGCSAAAMFALVLISLTWCRLQRGAKAAADIDYPAYGVTGPNKEVSPSGDQRLAHSAQMYHFQHQKQQIIAMEKSSTAREPGSVSEAESDEENEEGDYTVYECPGLAPAGEMEVKNPLFLDDPTPATPSQNPKDTDHSGQ